MSAAWQSFGGTRASLDWTSSEDSPCLQRGCQPTLPIFLAPSLPLTRSPIVSVAPTIFELSGKARVLFQHGCSKTFGATNAIGTGQKSNRAHERSGECAKILLEGIANAQSILDPPQSVFPRNCAVKCSRGPFSKSQLSDRKNQPCTTGSSSGLRILLYGEN